MGKPVIGETTKKQFSRDIEKKLLNHEDELFDILEIIKILKEKNILPTVISLLSENRNLNTSQLTMLKNGLKKGIEEAFLTINSGKELNTFQLMKLMKDPEINRAISFLLAFFKGMGKSI